MWIPLRQNGENVMYLSLKITMTVFDYGRGKKEKYES